MVTWITVGDDRILLTAYNPKSMLTMAKCVYALLRIADAMGNLSEEEFMVWLEREAPAVAERVKAGWKPAETVELTVDPRNAREEARIVALLTAEAQQQCGQTLPRPKLTVAQDKEV